MLYFYLIYSIKIKCQISIGKYLGLWALDLKTKRWENLLNEVANDIYNIKLKTRSGHSMLFNPLNQELIIMGGNKLSKKKNDSTYQLFDIMVYNIKSKTLKEMYHDFSREKGPDINFGMNALYNHYTKEILFFGGGYKSDNKQDIVSNNFWVLNTNSKKWTKLKKSEIFINYDGIRQEEINTFYNNNQANNFLFAKKDNWKNHKNYIETLEASGVSFGKESIKFNSLSNSSGLNYNLSHNVDEMHFQDSQLNEPYPRFAHGMIYSFKLNKGFIFGGNPNIKNGHSVRYNDFWMFSLFKPSGKEIKNLIKTKILKQSFLEACYTNNYEEALKILKKLKTLDNIEKHELKDMIKKLISPENKINIYSENNKDELYQKRYQLFDEIRQYIYDFSK